MKRNEIALILVIVGLVVLVTYSVANALFGQAALQPTNVKKADSIGTSVATPDPTVFNKDAINPAVTITIGDQANQQPFTIKN